MRFLLLTSSFPNPYDPTKAVFNLHLARALARTHEVEVISPISWLDEWRAKRTGSGKVSGDRSAVVDGIQVHYPRYRYLPRMKRSLYAWCLWRSVRRTVWKILRAKTPDAVLGYWAHPDGEAAIRIARLTGVPAVIMVGGSDILLLSGQRSRRKCVTNVLQAADAVVTASEDLRTKVIELGVNPHKVQVVYRGVDQNVFVPGERGEARRRLGIAPEPPTLVWVGRMVPVKGLDVLLEAAARLRDHGVDFRLHLVGDGPLRSSLEEQSRRRGLSEVISFKGRVDNRSLPDWYRAADLTVLPSRSEGVPNVLRESLACGTPFVASRVGGIAEIAEGPGNRLVPPENAVALADAIEQTLARRATAGQVRPNSCSWDASAAALVHILEPLVSRSQDHDRPWWAGKQQPVIKPPSPWKPLALRQLLRKAMATFLPHRLFLVRGRRQSKSVSLTFDDGPHPQHTPRLLDILKRHAIKATFFVVGRRVQDHPDLVRRIAAEGHDVANHSFFHSELDLLSAGEAAHGIRRTQELLRQLAGDVLPLYRPPRGKLTTWKLLGLWWLGMKVVLWNVDARDYALNNAAELSAWFRSHPLRAGDIVLLHDRLPLAVDALPELIETTRERGLDFVPLSQWTR
jgi:glycosyltransferase involved in cell wall biosynthesis/peptidoglycan/xylan/chitin deacetylase (PgdA/CDA1 family)